MNPRPWFWRPGRRPALRHALRSPRLAVALPPPDRLLDRLAAHGPDPRLFELVSEM